MKILAQNGGETMSEKIYNGKIKSIETSKVIARKGKRRILLSIIGIGDAFINWNKTPKGVEFPKGADIQVTMFRHDDLRWFVKEIISINGKPIKSQNSYKSAKNQRKKPLPCRWKKTNTPQKRYPQSITQGHWGKFTEIVPLRNGGYKH